MQSEHLIEKVHFELQQRFRTAGHGSVARVQKALRLNSAYFRDLRRPGRSHFDLRILLDALEVLEIQPSDFFAAVFGTSDPVESFCSEAQALFRRFRRRVGILELEAERQEPPTHPLDSKAVRLELAELNALRKVDPNKVLRRTRSLLPKVEDSLVPRVLAVHAAAFRVQGRLDEAQMVLGKAIEWVRSFDDPGLEAELYMRAGYVVASRGDFQRAVDLSERATVLFANHGDGLGIGKSLVERGNWLYGLERYDEASTLFEGALQHFDRGTSSGDEVESALDSENRIYHASCLLSLARTHLRLGDLEAARLWAAEARSRSQDTGLEPELAWMQASIARDRGDAVEAEQHLLDVVELYRGVAPVNTALAIVELARLQLESGRVEDSYETAKSMLTVIGDLESNPLVSAALTEVLRIVLAGRGLTLALLDQALVSLQSERTQSEHRVRPPSAS